MKLYPDYKCNCSVLFWGISSISRIFHLFIDVTSVDAPLTYCLLAMLLLNFIFVWKRIISFYFKYTLFYSIYMLYYFTKLVSWNNIIENVSIWPQGSIWNLKPNPFCLLVQIKMTVSIPLIYHSKTPIKQHKQNCKQMHQIIVL